MPRPCHEVMPRGFCEVDVIVACSFLYVRECQRTVGIGYIDNLIEPRDRITHMLCVGQWFFALIRERVYRVWQVALRRKGPCFS